jgi:hypothetical protein
MPTTQYPIEIAAADPVLFCAMPKYHSSAVAGGAASAVAERASAAVAGAAFDAVAPKRSRGAKRPPCPIELFIAAGTLPFDMHRLPWNAVFVCTGSCRCEGSLPSANHKLGFHVVGSTRYAVESSRPGDLGGPLVGARASAVAAVTLVDEVGWDLGATTDDGTGIPTVCAVFDLTLAEEPARELLGDRPVRMAVLVTTSITFAGALHLIVGFVLRMNPELVVIIHPHGISMMPPAVPHLVCTMAGFVNDGRSHYMDQLYAEPHLAVARMCKEGSPRYRLGMPSQKQFENRPMVRNIKISSGSVF